MPPVAADTAASYVLLFMYSEIVKGILFPIAPFS